MDSPPSSIVSPSILVRARKRLSRARGRAAAARERMSRRWIDSAWAEAFSRSIDPRDSRHLRPRFLVIGVQKGGTHTLFYDLPQHPDIVPAKVKEVCFFNEDANFTRGVRWYHRHFPLRRGTRPTALAFEASVGYVHHFGSAARIRDYDPAMKMILILRDPVERAFSHWNMGRNLARTHPDSDLVERRAFEEIVREEMAALEAGRPPSPPLPYLPRGLYLEQIENYLECFPRDRLFITETGRLKRNPAGVMDAIVEFLGLPPFAWDEDRLSVGYKADYRDRRMDEVTRRALADFYRPHNRRLFDFLGESFDWT